jgi:hypothetical protein
VVAAGRVVEGGGDDPPCEWHVVIEDDFQFGIYDVDSLETQHSATGRWLERWCEGIGAVAVDGYFIIPEGGLVDPYQLALDALASVQIAPPAIRTSPEENGRLYVQVPTWLWLDSTWWQTYDRDREHRSCLVHGDELTGGGRPGSSVTVAACRAVDPGTPWRPARRRTRVCTHTYRSSSASGRVAPSDL